MAVDQNGKCLKTNPDTEFQAILVPDIDNQ